MNQRTSIRALVLASAMFAMASVARSQSGLIQYVSQNRYVQAQGYDWSVFVKDSVYASDLGPFDELLKVGLWPYGEAQQSSVLSANQMVASGHGFGTHYMQNLNGGGTSYLLVQFQVQQPLTFSLFGKVDGIGWGETSLIGPGVDLQFVSSFSFPGPHNFFEIGTLSPGTYTLLAEGSGWGYNANWSTSGSFNFTLNVAPICDADCDKSGTLNIDDFICFQTLYAIGHPSADCDQSGGLNIDDFVCFQTLYAIGC